MIKVIKAVLIHKYVRWFFRFLKTKRKLFLAMKTLLHSTFTKAD